MTLRRTANLARVLWFGSLAVGALLGGGVAAAVTIRLTTPKEN